MEYLIKQGVPQRTGHEIVGHLVGLCESKKCRLADLSPEEFALGPSPSSIPESIANLGVANAVKAFRSYGSTAPDEVEKQLGRWQAQLGHRSREDPRVRVPLITGCNADDALLPHLPGSSRGRLGRDPAFLDENRQDRSHGARKRQVWGPGSSKSHPRFVR